MSTPVMLIAIASIVVGATALAVVVMVAKRRACARLNAEGFQELDVLVKGRYRPDVIEVRRGIPVRLHFRREESTPCSQHLIFSDFHVGTHLPAYETTSVCFIPTKSGEFLFTCAFGMYQGRLVVVEPSKRAISRARQSNQVGEEEPYLAAGNCSAPHSMPGGSPTIHDERDAS